MLSHWGIIVLALVEGAREKRGAEWCRKWGVGYARRSIGEPSRKVIGLVSDPDLEDRIKASDTLKAYCRRCGRCSMAHE